MKKAYMAVAVSVLTLAGAALGVPDNYASGAGAHPVNTNSAARGGGEYGNPALLGLDGNSGRGLAIFPLTFGLRSDELALSVPSIMNKYLLEGDMPRYVTYIMNESFDLWDIKGKGSGAELKRSQKLTEELKGGGINLSVGVRTAPVVFSMNGFSGSLRSYVDLDLKLPGDLLLLLLSHNEGLLRGNTLDLSALKVDAIAATELAFKMGRPIYALPEFFDYLNLDKGAWGVGVKQILGHSYVSVSAKDGSRIEYDNSSNTAIVDAEFDVVHVGTGLNLGKPRGGRLNLLDSDEMDGVEWFDAKNSLLGSPVTGWGWGFDLGAAFHNNSHFVSVDMRDIGLIVWNGRETRETTLSFDGKTQPLDAETEEITIEDYFRLTMSNTADSRKSLVTWLPMSLNLGYTYYYDLSYREEAANWVSYLAADAAVRQQLITGPGKNTYVPELSVGGMAGLFKNGALPLRYWIILGGPDKLSSVFSTGINTRCFSFDLFWKTFGSPLMTGKKGFEAASLFTVNWGKNKQRIAGDDISDVIVSRPPATIQPDEKIDGLADSAMALYRRVKTAVDTVTADLDAKDAAEEEDSVLTPDDGGEDSPPEDSMR